MTVGTRQQNREHGAERGRARATTPTAIADAMRDQIDHGRYERDELFGDGTAGRRIAEVLATARPTIQKRARTTTWSG